MILKPWPTGKKPVVRRQLTCECGKLFRGVWAKQCPDCAYKTKIRQSEEARKRRKLRLQTA